MVLREELLAASPAVESVELNVGGTVVPLSTKSLALLAVSRLGRDGQGRPFVDVPFKAAEPLLDAVRLRALQGGSGPLHVRVDRDTRAVAEALGLEVRPRRSYALALGALALAAWACWMRGALGAKG